MRGWKVAVLAAIVAAAAPATGRSSPLYDIVIVGGHVLDGSGNPPFRADVAVAGDRVAAIGDLGSARARTRIDAGGKIIAPGFIDIHSHAFDYTGPNRQRDLADGEPARLSAPNLVTQGITLAVINQDGRSPPLADQRAWMERSGIGMNVVQLVGHGTVRRAAMGEDVERVARPDEVARMRALVHEAMEAGAFGLSAALEYVPGRWSDTDELVALAAEIVPYRGVYISHQRAEGSDPMWFWPSQDEAGAPDLLAAVRETIEIGERTGATVVASHLKAKGAHYWGSGRAAIQLIEAARARGVEIYGDHYPYDTSGSDGATVLLPPWALAPGTGAKAAAADYAARIATLLVAPERAADLRRDIGHEISRRGGADKIAVLAYPDSTFVGRTLGELAKARGVNPVEMAILLQTEGFRDRPGGAQLRGYSMSEIDNEAFAARNWVATSSDAGNTLPGDEFASLHPRYYGAFPRKIRHYALDRGVLTIEDAIRSMTSLPAQILGLTDRGTLTPGAAADLVILDPARIRDVATATDIHRYSEGVDWVLVNGTQVVENGRVTGKLPGRVILNPRRNQAVR